MSDMTHSGNGGHPPFSIRLEDICKRFGPVQANRHVDLSVEKGTISRHYRRKWRPVNRLGLILYGFYSLIAAP